MRPLSSGQGFAFLFSGYLVSGLWVRASVFWLRISGLRFKVSGFGYLVSGLWFWVLGADRMRRMLEVLAERGLAATCVEIASEYILYT